jgi:hypothetical protein
MIGTGHNGGLYRSLLIVGKRNKVVHYTRVLQVKTGQAKSPVLANSNRVGWQPF